MTIFEDIWVFAFAKDNFEEKFTFVNSKILKFGETKLTWRLKLSQYFAIMHCYKWNYDSLYLEQILFFYWLNESKADLMFLSSSFVGVPEVCHESLWKFLLSKMLNLRKLIWYLLSFGQLIFHNIFHSVHFCSHKDTSFLFLSWRNVKGILFSKVKESDKISFPHNSFNFWLI